MIARGYGGGDRWRWAKAVTMGMEGDLSWGDGSMAQRAEGALLSGTPETCMVCELMSLQ